MNEPKPEVADDLPEQLRIRREKRESLLSRGIAPYPVAVPRTAKSALQYLATVVRPRQEK